MHRPGAQLHSTGSTRRHHLKEAVVEVVVEGHIQHQGVLGIEGSGVLRAAGGGMGQNREGPSRRRPLLIEKCLLGKQ